MKTYEDNHRQLVINFLRYRKTIKRNMKTKDKIKIKWRIHKRRMKSSKRQHLYKDKRGHKFERSRDVNLTDCIDKMKFYSRLSVPSRKASAISKQVNSTNK